MSRDDTTLIVKVKIKKRHAYIVRRVQSAESFEDWKWLVERLGDAPLFTRDIRTAVSIAEQLDKADEPSEYGIRCLFLHQDLEYPLRT
jgi:hypothetical protein